MKILKILVATSLTLAAASSFAAYTPAAGIKGTPHDWSASGRSFLLWCKDAAACAAGTTTTYAEPGYLPWTDPATGKQGKAAPVSIGMCTTCHTPHQARSTNLLWNHTLTSTEYEWDVPATTAGTVYPKFKGDTYQGASTKCLSCHDGQLSSTDGMWFNRARVSTSKYVAAAGSLNSGHEVAEGKEMSGSHPVAFPYPYGNAPSAYNGTTTGSAALLDEFIADPTVYGIRLFNDDGNGNITAGAAAGMTGMECTSCHDVHNGKGTKDQLLLRGKLVGSDTASGYLCEQCHQK